MDNKIRIRAMKQYLIPILIVLVLASGLMVSCSQKQSTSELTSYLSDELPIIERHTETVATISKAIEAVASEARKPTTPKDDSSVPPKTQMEAIEQPAPQTALPVTISQLSPEEIIAALRAPRTPPSQPTIPSGLKEALTSVVDNLDWALEQMDSEILDYKRLTPPPEARTYHGLMIEIMLKEQAIYSDIHSHYSSLLSYGYGDDEALDRVEKLSDEVSRLGLLFQYEFKDLLEKAGLQELLEKDK